MLSSKNLKLIIGPALILLFACGYQSLVDVNQINYPIFKSGKSGPGKCLPGANSSPTPRLNPKH